MNNKIVSVVLVAGIAATGFAGMSSANDTSSGSFFTGNSEIKELFEKVKSGEELSADEQAILDKAKANKTEKGAKFGGKRKGGGNLTDEELAALEAMSDDEKKEFFVVKKEEMNEVKQENKAVITALLGGESLTADQEATRLEMLAKIEEKAGQGSGLIAKILAGDALTADEEAQIAAMQAKKAEREAQKAILEPIKAKLEAGEELTDEEQTLLDDVKSQKLGKNNRSK